MSVPILESIGSGRMYYERIRCLYRNVTRETTDGVIVTSTRK